jgi:deoxyribodipyrimidine photo-lyase
MVVDRRRVRSLNEYDIQAGSVVYWMQRDQRVQDNWALLYAQEEALSRSVPLVVVFTLSLIKGRANLRQYDFMLTGLAEVEESLAALQIPFFLLEGKPEEVLPVFYKEHNVGQVVTDFSPMRYARDRRAAVASILPCRLTEVDAHNIIPCWEASPKEEFAAYTFRPKVHRALADFLTPFSKLKKHPYQHNKKSGSTDWAKVQTRLPLDMSVAKVTHIKSGMKAGDSMLKSFISSRLDTYHTHRNDPTLPGVSGLSPYLHFGQLSAQRVALEVSAAHDAPKEAREAFLEELIVRRELADNYCFYNHNHDKLEGAHVWAQKTIEEHAKDAREYEYTLEQFENAQTHDDLWNAMQLQMVKEGKMHGWCRMYWAKKILEWTPDIQTAIDIALYLNDKYELDGNDPNGVTGVMWSICGVHDRAWNERSIFGKIRYMNYAGAKRKFAIKEYIQRYEEKVGLFE